MSYSNDNFEINMGSEAIKIEFQNAESTVGNQLERNLIENIIARERVSTSDFICLASQFGILEAVLSSNLLQSGGSNFNQVLSILNNTIKFIGEPPVFDPNFYNSLVIKLRSISANNTEICNVEILLSTLFQELNTIAREENMNESQRNVCIQVFERESSRAKYWLSKIIEETIDFPRYQLLFKKHQRFRPFGTSTEEPEFRHVQIQFFPSSSETRDFFLLSFKFFHEYFSHFYTCNKFTYPYKIDLRFKDGWLFHTIENFCLKNLDILLDEGTLDEYTFKSLRHLRHPISTHIQDYMNTNIRGLSKPFYEETELSNGHNLATDFLKFLTQCFSNENDGERRARHLYYRFSWDLIQHSPSDRFSQGNFIDRLGVQLKYVQDESHATLLTRDIIRANITIGEDQQERVDIGKIWDILSSDLEFKNIDESMADPF